MSKNRLPELDIQIIKHRTWYILGIQLFWKEGKREGREVKRDCVNLKDHQVSGVIIFYCNWESHPRVCNLKDPQELTLIWKHSSPRFWDSLQRTTSSQQIQFPYPMKRPVPFMKVKVKVKPLSRVWFFAIPWTVVYQASLSMGFSRQEYWSGLPFPSPEVPFISSVNNFLVLKRQELTAYQNSRKRALKWQLRRAMDLLYGTAVFSNSHHSRKGHNNRKTTVSIHTFASFCVVIRKSTSESYTQFPQMTKNNFPRKNVPALKLFRSSICTLLQLFLIKLTLSEVCLDKNHEKIII